MNRRVSKATESRGDFYPLVAKETPPLQIPIHQWGCLRTKLSEEPLATPLKRGVSVSLLGGEWADFFRTGVLNNHSNRAFEKPRNEGSLLYYLTGDGWTGMWKKDGTDSRNWRRRMWNGMMRTFRGKMRQNEENARVFKWLLCRYSTETARSLGTFCAASERTNFLGRKFWRVEKIVKYFFSCFGVTFKILIFCDRYFFI